MTQEEFDKLSPIAQYAIENCLAQTNQAHGKNLTIEDVFYLSCGEFFFYGRGPWEYPQALDNLYLPLHDGFGTMQRVVTRRYNLLELHEIIDILIKRHNPVPNPELESSKEKTNETLGETSL